MKELSSWLSACAVLLYAVLIVCVPFPFGVWGRMWNSIVSVPNHGLFILFPIKKKDSAFSDIYVKNMSLLKKQLFRKWFISL